MLRGLGPSPGWQDRQGKLRGQGHSCTYLASGAKQPRMGPRLPELSSPWHPSQVAASQGRPTESPHIVRVGCTPARQAHPRLQGLGLQGWTPDGDQEGLSCQQGPWSCPSWTSQPATQGCVYTGQALLEGGPGRRGARGGAGRSG